MNKTYIKEGGRGARGRETGEWMEGWGKYG